MYLVPKDLFVYKSVRICKNQITNYTQTFLSQQWFFYDLANQLNSSTALELIEWKD